MGDAALGHELLQVLRELRGHDGDGGAGLEQQRDAPFGDDTAADDEYGALLQIREQG